MMQLLDGKLIAKQIKEELKSDIDLMVSVGSKRPHLAAILVGNNPASQAYVGNKIRTCNEVGMTSSLIQLDENVSEQVLLEEIEKLNQNDEIDGYIVQLPLPKHISEEKVTLAIDYHKDVDGFHPMNFGRMALGMDSYLPATPMGILELLKRYKIDTAGKKCVVLGRSNIVGTPMSILLSRKGWDCTVTLAHSRTQDLAGLCREADIIIAAIGIPHFVKADMVSNGAIVIDVGINRINDSNTKSGTKLVGDVDFEKVKDKCSFITPVPGGVGLLTVTSLLQNTMQAMKLNLEFRKINSEIRIQNSEK
jgi:methylenetetrahydrofolate dehydrogenase (NADP+) / methenyltetrahydrofolate cyclohydrolase